MFRSVAKNLILATENFHLDRVIVLHTMQRNTLTSLYDYDYGNDIIE